jgi:hypothetical protein
MTKEVSNFSDFEEALSNTEKNLAARYKKGLNSGKGSRPVVILILPQIEKLVVVLLQNRYKYIPDEITITFSPGHKIKWGRGDAAIRKLTQKIKLQNSLALTSNRLRRHIATVMQILNLSKDIKEFSQFMGHTLTTHEEFYEYVMSVMINKIILCATVREMSTSRTKNRLPNSISQPLP